jgi:hypothetical protein
MNQEEMENKLFCNECKKEVQVGEQTDLAECIDYKYNHDGIICEICGKLKGFSNVMILPLKREEMQIPVLE